jgi:hypothetical protein
VHDKYMIVEGGYDGRPDQKIVFTGSHTYTESALRSNDETVLKYIDDDIYDAYRAQFATVYAAALLAEPQAGNASVIAPTN